MKQKQFLKIFCVLLCILIVTFACKDKKNPVDNDDDNSDNKLSKHAIVIGIDGLMGAAVGMADTPNLDELIAGGTVSYNAYAGGILNTPTQQATSSGPSWSSILTGVWLDKHNVPNNSFSNPNYDEYPHFFKRIKENVADAYLASIVQWKPINDHITSNADFVASGSGLEVALKTQTLLQAENPDALFLHFDDVDGAGHAHGYNIFNQEYLKVIAQVDSYIGIVISSIRERPNYSTEDWLIVVVSDHGGSGTSHGGQTENERKVILLASGGNVNKGKVISPGPGIVAVPPTVLKHLSIEINPTWGWEAEPFGF